MLFIIPVNGLPVHSSFSPAERLDLFDNPVGYLGLKSVQVSQNALHFAVF
jgi:hypothetical protein